MREREGFSIKSSVGGAGSSLERRGEVKFLHRLSFGVPDFRAAFGSQVNQEETRRSTYVSFNPFLSPPYID